MTHHSVSTILMTICLTLLYVLSVYDLPFSMAAHTVLTLLATAIFAAFSSWLCRKVWKLQ
jgi:hypothetical protein